MEKKDVFSRINPRIEPERQARIPGEADASRQCEYAAESVRRMHNRCTAETIDRLSAGMVRSYQGLLEDHYQQFVAHHRAVRQTVGLRLELATIQMDVELMYVELRARLSDRLAEFEPRLAPRAPPSQDEMPTPRRPRARISVDLDRLGKFDGRMGSWRGFRERFTRMVHANDDIPPATKFTYLVHSLTARARQMTADWVVSAETYARTWEQFSAFFDNTHEQLMAYLDEMVDMPMTQETEVSRLRRMAEHIQFMNEEIAAMEDQRLDAWSDLIVFSARRAMGAELTRIYATRNSTQSAQTLLAFLHEYQAEIQARPNADGQATHHARRETRRPEQNGAAPPNRPANQDPSAVVKAEGQNKTRGEKPALAETGGGDMHQGAPSTGTPHIKNQDKCSEKVRGPTDATKGLPWPGQGGTRTTSADMAPAPPAPRCTHCDCRDHETHECLFHFGPRPERRPVVVAPPQPYRLPRPTSREFRLIKCGNCTLSHLTEDCRFFDVLTLSARRVRVRARNLCWRCLNGGHGPEQCWVEEPCKRCGPGRFHHKLLCHKREAERKAPNRKNAANKGEPDKGAIGQGPFKPRGVVDVPACTVRGPQEDQQVRNNDRHDQERYKGGQYMPGPRNHAPHSRSRSITPKPQRYKEENRVRIKEPSVQSPSDQGSISGKEGRARSEKRSGDGKKRARSEKSELRRAAKKKKKSKKRSERRDRQRRREKKAARKSSESSDSSDTSETTSSGWSRPESPNRDLSRSREDKFRTGHREYRHEESDASRSPTPTRRSREDRRNKADRLSRSSESGQTPIQKAPSTVRGKPADMNADQEGVEAGPKRQDVVHEPMEVSPRKSPHAGKMNPAARPSSIAATDGGDLSPTREDQLLRSDPEDEVVAEDGTVAALERLCPTPNRQTIRTTISLDVANPAQVTPAPPDELLAEGQVADVESKASTVDADAAHQ